MLKRLISVVLSAALVLPMMFSMPLEADAAVSKSDPHTVNKAGWIAAWETDEVMKDMVTSLYYSDDLFKVDSLAYSDELADVSFDLSQASLKSKRAPDTEEGYMDKARNLEAYLEDNGFADFEVNADYTTPYAQGCTPVALAHKTIMDGGKPYTLLVITLRGGTTDTEFLDNMTFSSSSNDTGDHAGFRDLTEKCIAYVKDYVNRCDMKGDLKVWMSGYSRSAGVINLMGAALIDDPKAALGSSIGLAPKDIFCYTYGCPRTGSAAEGCEDSKYDRIHNLVDPWDMSTCLPTASMGFGRYGTDVAYAAWSGYKTAAEKTAVKNRMLNIMEKTNKGSVDAYYGSGADPDNFHPKKLDTKALLSGRMQFVADEDSYIPDDYGVYLEAMTEELAALGTAASKDGKNTRQGFYDNYEGPFARFATFGFGSGLGSSFGAFADSKFTIPMVLSMYTTFMVEKSLDNRSVKINDLIEASFNTLAYYVEDENGFVKSEYRRIERYYDLVRAGLFEENAAGISIAADDSGSTIPLRYTLKKGVDLNKGLTFRLFKKLSAVLYAQMMKGVMTQQGFDQDFIDQMTSDEDSSVMSYVIMHLAFGNPFQSDEVQPFSLDNEQFKQAATFADAAGRAFSLHNFEILSAYMRARDENYRDYAGLTAAQAAGYRRVYISSSEGNSIRGTVKDGSGSTVATFVDDDMISRTDEWIGITTCDSDSWLRLPIDKDYTVELTAGRAGTIDTAVGEYDIESGEVVRHVDRDDERAWGAIPVRAGDTVTVTLPAVSTLAFPSDAAYSVTVPEEPAVPEILPAGPVRLAARGVAVGSRSLRFTWTGIGSAKRYAITVTENGASAGETRYVDADTRAYVWKGLKKGTVYKFRIDAQKVSGDSVRNIASGRTSYVITGNARGSYTNPKAVKVNKTKVVLKKGRSFRIRAGVTRAVSGGKLLKYTDRLRYFSSNKKVATVSSKGIVKAAGKGSCKVYVQAVNGVWKAVTIKVK